MNNTPTPRTDKEIQRYMMTHFITQDDDDGYAVKANFARQLETELTAVTEQRDRLAEALKEYREALHDGPENCSYKMYEAVDEFAEKALQYLNQAAVKGGSDEPQG